MSPTHCSKQRCRLFIACRLSTREHMQVFPEVTCHVPVLDTLHSLPACTPSLVYHQPLCLQGISSKPQTLSPRGRKPPIRLSDALPGSLVLIPFLLLRGDPPGFI